MMKFFIKTYTRKALAKFDLAVMRASKLKVRSEANQSHRDLQLLLALPRWQAPQLLDNLEKSKSQIRQDLFALSELDFKKDGYFVDFGATNGVNLSNSFLLEKEFGWKGILAEPAKCWHAELRQNRNCHIETNCVWRESNACLTFNEIAYPELSTIKDYTSSDLHANQRTEGKSYNVNTISLIDLLRKYDAPREIDYLSIDTEGSELEILQAFDFSQYRFRVITCEHNYTPYREKIFDLLSKNGYERKMESFSYFDDWYVLSARN